MRWLTVLGFVTAFVAFMHLTAAEDYEVRPTYPDLYPNDGFFDAGTMYNPYVVAPQGGQPFGMIRARYPDLHPNDGVFDAGTYSNPYTLQTND